MDDMTTGAALRALGSGVTDARVLALLGEAARIADRLDELDRIISGKGVLELMRFRVPDAFDDGDDRHVAVEVKFDGVLAEARQQASTLRALLVTLGVEKLKAGERGGSILDQLAARRAERQAAAAGRVAPAVDV